MVQAALPGMHVLPAFVLTRCDPAAQLGGIFCALLAGALSYQLAVQFRGSTSRLTPGFGPPQGDVAAIWCGITVLVTAWFLTRNGFSAMFTLALATAVTTAVIAVGTLALQSAFRKTPINNPVAVLAPLTSLMVPTLLLPRPWWFEIYGGATLAGCGSHRRHRRVARLAAALGARETPDVAKLQGNFAVPGPLGGVGCRLGRAAVPSTASKPCRRLRPIGPGQPACGGGSSATSPVDWDRLVLHADRVGVHRRWYLVASQRSWRANALPWQFALIYFSALLPIQEVAMALGDWSGRIRSVPLESTAPRFQHRLSSRTGRRPGARSVRRPPCSSPAAPRWR